MALRGSISNAITTAGANITLSMTAGWTGSPPSVGDIIILEITADKATATFAVAGSTFSAIPSVVNMNVVGSQGTCTLSAVYRVADGTETTLTISTSGSHFYSVTARAYSGRNSSPFVVTPVTTGPNAVSAQPLTLAITGLTANAGDDLVLLLGANGLGNQTNDTWTLTPPSGFSNVVTVDPTGGTFAIAIHSCDSLNVTAGATGTLGGTISNVSTEGVALGAYLMSLATGTVIPAGPGPIPRQIYVMP